MKPARVLLTEDDPGIRTVMRIQLQAMGHLVAEAPNGALAMDILCAENPPEVVLLDLSMPGVDGYEFLEAIQAMTPRPPSRVIVVTADRTPGLAADMASLGAAGFVHKPLRKNDLQRIMELTLKTIPPAPVCIEEFQRTESEL